MGPRGIQDQDIETDEALRALLWKQLAVSALSPHTGHQHPSNLLQTCPFQLRSGLLMLQYPRLPEFPLAPYIHPRGSSRTHTGSGPGPRSWVALGQSLWWQSGWGVGHISHSVTSWKQELHSRAHRGSLASVILPALGGLWLASEHAAFLTGPFPKGQGHMQLPTRFTQLKQGSGVEFLPANGSLFFVSFERRSCCRVQAGLKNSRGSSCMSFLNARITVPRFCDFETGSLKT